MTTPNIDTQFMAALDSVFKELDRIATDVIDGKRPWHELVGHVSILVGDAGRISASFGDPVTKALTTVFHFRQSNERGNRQEVSEQFSQFMSKITGGAHRG